MTAKATEPKGYAKSFHLCIPKVWGGMLILAVCKLEPHLEEKKKKKTRGCCA